MRRNQDRASLREQKARIVAYLRAKGLTHDPQFKVSQSSVSYTVSPPGTPTTVMFNGSPFTRIHGGFCMNEPRDRRTVRK